MLPYISSVNLDVHKIVQSKLDVRNTLLNKIEDK